MATGRVAEAVPVYEDLVARIPDMSFPISSLLRAHAFLEPGRPSIACSRARPREALRDVPGRHPFVRAKRRPLDDNLAAYRSEFEAHVAVTGGVDVSRAGLCGHLGPIDEAYRAADRARLGPAGPAPTHRPRRLPHRAAVPAGMPELATTALRAPVRAPRAGGVRLATGQWPDCADEVPYDFRRACEQVRDVPEDDFGF